MLVWISTLVLAIIAVGLIYRKRPEVHIPCMSLAFAIDIGLVLYIEWSRHAIETVGKELTAPLPEGLLLFHVAVSLLTLVLYGVQMFSGVKLFKGVGPGRNFHRNVGYGFIVCRLANYVTSFFVV